MVGNVLDNSLTRGNKAEIASWASLDFSRAVGTGTSSYTATKDGFFIVCCQGTSSNNSAHVRVELKNQNGNVVFTMGNRFQLNGASGPASVMLPVPKGFTVNPISTDYMTYAGFIPFKGE